MIPRTRSIASAQSHLGGARRIVRLAARSCFVPWLTAWLVLTAAVADGMTNETGGAMPATLKLAVTQSHARSAGSPYRIDADGLGANPRHGLALAFTPRGAHIEGRDGGFALGLQRFGRGDGDPVRHAPPHIDGAWVEYQRGAGLSEWFANLPEGLEQGWMVTDRPTGTGPLVLELDTATPPDRVDGEQFSWSGLIYHRLVTLDAEGRVLSTRWTHDGARLRIEVDDHGVVYPLLIDPWIQEEIKLSASDGAPGDELGTSVALADDTALVGAPNAQIDGNFFQGAAYVFTRSDGIWSQQAKLTASDGAAFDKFGGSLALSGDTAVVGAAFAGIDGGNPLGAAYIFVRDGEIWTQQAKLTASDGTAWNGFGASVALAGDTALVGAPSGPNETQVGAVYVFNRDGDVWFQRTKLTADDADLDNRFGSSIAFNNGTALIGAPATNQSPGGAYVFNRDEDGVWGQRAKLIPDDGVEGDVFGQDVALSADTALVGAWGVNGFQGAAYVFTGADETWIQQAKLTASDGAEEDVFGGSVALAGDTALVGARANISGRGAAYVYTRSNGTWSERNKLTASDGASDDWFGESLAMTDDTALVGAPRADVGGNADQGATYVFVDFVPPPEFGTIEGTVRSLGYCRADVAPLEGVTVEILGAENTYTAETDANGFYRAFLPPSESPLDMTVAVPGHLLATVEDISFTGGETVAQDFDLILEAPCASVDPTALSVVLNPDQTTTEILTIGNTAAAAEDLSWTITTAEPATPGDELVASPGVHPTLPTGAVVDCENEPRIIIQDDGTIELGYGGNADVVDQVSFIEKFTPSAYPSAIRAVCLAWAAENNPEEGPTPTSLNFEIVAFADDGPDGGPGTELGALVVTATGIPPWPVDTPTWVSFDIRSLGISVGSGSVYIGARWAPSEPNVFLAADHNPAHPPGFAGGYWWTDIFENWRPTEVNWLQYRAMFVRVVESDCLDPTAIPWLSVDPTAGSTPVGSTSEVQVSFNSAALTPGEYQASVCIATNDPLKPLTALPVTLTVTVPAPSLVFDPLSLDFGEVEVGDTSAPLMATLTNGGDADATDLTFTPPGGDFTAETGACGDTLAAAASCDIVVTFTPAEPGPAVATLHVDSAEAAAADLELAGAGVAARVVTPVALDVDPDAFLSDGNGVFEPGELVEVMPSWRNDGLFAESLSGSASEFGGDGGFYFLALDDADYGPVEPGATARCDDTGVCYFLGVNAPSGRPATHWMASFEETLSEGTAETWSLHIGDSFTDVPRSSPFYTAIETLLHSGITGGCTETEYCPAGTNTRGQMAVFLLKAAEGGDYLPTACVEDDERFLDIPAGSPLCPWIEELAARGVTAGCGSGNYCPGDPVSRAQMAVFLLRAFEDPGYAPPECTGEFADVTCPSPFAAWVEELAARGVTGGCSADPPAYCPADSVTRAQMAVFVTRTFGLTLYGP